MGVVLDLDGIWEIVKHPIEAPMRDLESLFCDELLMCFDYLKPPAARAKKTLSFWILPP